MKTTLTCPKCNHRAIWVIDPVTQPNDPSHAIERFVVVARETSPGVRSVAGRYEVFVCAGCGYTEWYAKDLANLQYFAADPSYGVRLLEGGGSHGAYR